MEVATRFSDDAKLLLVSSCKGGYAVSLLVGEANRDLSYRLTMMNLACLGIGVGGMVVSEFIYLSAVRYAYGGKYFAKVIFYAIAGLV